MRDELGLRDRKWASCAAIALLGVAAFIILVIHPGGFEGQFGWVIGLMPGAIVAFPIAQHAFKVVPAGYSIVLWSLMLGISFVWYFVISYVLIKIYRCLFVR